MGAGHAHGMKGAEKGADNERRLRYVLVLSGTFLVAEVVGGLVTGSLALLADAGHMLTDVAGVALALVAIRFARRKATPERTYGFHRGEILASLANCVVLVGISAYVLYEAWHRMWAPPKIATTPMMLVAIGGMAVNVIGVLLLKSGAEQSLNMKGAYFEVISDLLSSVAVLIAGAIMWATGWYYADPILSAGIGLFILPRTWVLMKEAVGVLLEGTPSDVNIAALREALGGINGVSGVHDLHVWSLTSGVNALSAHVVSARPSDEIVREARQALVGAFKVSHLTFQVEREHCGDLDHL